MTNTNANNQFHSGKRLQKLRDYQGLSVEELATVLQLDSSTLKEWESKGIPEEAIQQFTFYFEVSALLFSEPVNNELDLDELVRGFLFPQNENALLTLLYNNERSKSELLDLSGLALNKVPADIFEYTWLTTINISNNQIKQLPSSLLLLPQLKQIDVSNNLLQTIPGFISTLKCLRQLNFQNNPLKLQPDLLNSSMSIDAYLAYMAETRKCVAVMDSLTQENLLHLDTIRSTIEQSQPLIIAQTDTFGEFVTHYKNISSLVYVSENQEPAQLAGKVRPLLQGQTLPLVILSLSTMTSEQRSACNKSLLELEPDKNSFIKLADSKEDFASLFSDILIRITYEDQLPCVKFDRLVLNNIGVYEHLEIDFNPELTVLIGLNGTGKTTVLKALALAILGPEKAEIDANTAANLLRITGKQGNQTLWQPQGSIQLYASINGKSYDNIIHLVYNSNNENVQIKGKQFDAMFNADDNLINLMLGIGEQRNTNLKKPPSLGLEVVQPKVKDLLPIISGEEQACIAHFGSWLGNRALLVSQGEMDKQQAIDVSFAIFSALMQESIQFVGLTKVEPLELWVEHQNPKQVVPLRLASQGYQAVMGWVGYIIQRMFEAYSGSIQPLQQHAIIFIDEIDQLLHIKWQHKIINILAKQFFPNSQWIITTHSPMVVAGLDQKQVIQLHQLDGKLVAEPNCVDLWLWQYGDIVRHLFEVSPEKPKEQEQLLLKNIASIKALPPSDITPSQQQELEKLEKKLERVQKSRAFIDEIYAEQQKLHSKEQELSMLIEQLSQQQAKS